MIGRKAFFKKFLGELREARRELRAKAVLERGAMIRFTLKKDGEKYCPITLVCANKNGVYLDSSFQIRRAAHMAGVPAEFRDEINLAADRYPTGYNHKLRRQLMRAAGRWS